MEHFDFKLFAVFKNVKISKKFMEYLFKTVWETQYVLLSTSKYFLTIHSIQIKDLSIINHFKSSFELKTWILYKFFDYFNLKKNLA